MRRLWKECFADLQLQHSGFDFSQHCWLLIVIISVIVVGIHARSARTGWAKEAIATSNKEPEQGNDKRATRRRQEGASVEAPCLRMRKQFMTMPL